MKTTQNSLKLRNLRLQLLPDFGIKVVGINVVTVPEAVAEIRIDQFNAEFSINNMM